MTSSCSQSPDILSNKVFVGLDLVASSLHGTSKMSTLNTEPPRHINFPPKVIITPDDAIAKILESETVILPSELIRAEADHERTKPDGHEEHGAIEKSLEPLKEEEEEYTDEKTNFKKSTSPIPRKSDSVLKLCDESVPSLPKLSDEKLDSVLDSISHDLDYLLNRSGGDVEEIGQTNTLRRVSKPPGASVKHKIPEELLTEDSTDIPESVTLRTDC